MTNILILLIILGCGSRNKNVGKASALDDSRVLAKENCIHKNLVYEIENQ